MNLAQPDERTNLTVLTLSFDDWKGRRKGTTTRINQCRVRSGGLKFYVKSRITRRMEHPIPRGRWEGTCTYTDKWAVFTFQAMTMRVKPKDEPKIVLPDGSSAKGLTLPATTPAKKGRIVLP
jgi:hypothetical protein